MKKSKSKKQTGQTAKKPRLADYALSAPEGASPEMKAVFESAEPIRNALLAGMVKSDGQTFVTKTALLTLVCHIAIHLVKIRAIESQVSELTKKLAVIIDEREQETKDWLRSMGMPASRESQNETNPETGSVSGNDPDASTLPSAP